MASVQEGEELSGVCGRKQIPENSGRARPCGLLWTLLRDLGFIPQ